jgi:hypothetical protein
MSYVYMDVWPEQVHPEVRRCAQGLEYGSRQEVEDPNPEVRWVVACGEGWTEEELRRVVAKTCVRDLLGRYATTLEHWSEVTDGESLAAAAAFCAMNSSTMDKYLARFFAMDTELLAARINEHKVTHRAHILVNVSRIAEELGVSALLPAYERLAGHRDWPVA